MDLAEEFDQWLASPLGDLHIRLLVKWREETQARWASDSLGDSRIEEQMRGQAIFIKELLEMDGKVFVEELKAKGVI